MKNAHNKQSFFDLSLIILGFLMMGFSSVALGRQGVSVASGIGAANIVPLRIGFQLEFEKHWRTDTHWPVGGYWEMSVYDMHTHNKAKPKSHRHLNAAAFAGVLRFERDEPVSLGWPYLELGLGVSWLSKKEIGGRDLGWHFQFEDRFGLGLRFGENREYDLSYRAIHFSNAYMGPCNHGINLHVLVLGYWFK
jgi:lipid A 3-O-deacylase